MKSIFDMTYFVSEHVKTPQGVDPADQWHLQQYGSDNIDDLSTFIDGRFGFHVRKHMDEYELHHLDVPFDEFLAARFNGSCFLVSNEEVTTQILFSDLAINLPNWKGFKLNQSDFDNPRIPNGKPVQMQSLMPLPKHDT